MLDDAQILTPLAYQDFFRHLRSEFLSSVRVELNDRLAQNLRPQRNRQLADWKMAISQLPAVLGPQERPLLSYENGVPVLGNSSTSAQILPSLRSLMPWRKGPYRIFGVDIDSEWRSDWKWERLRPHIQPLAGRRVLDIGSGNGYYLWRMYEEGVAAAVGLEPHLLNLAQFAVMQRYLHDLAVTVLPMRLQDYPVNTRIYDTVFSMGVLYHCKSPVEHLLHCKSSLREGGELVLETLVVNGDEKGVLIPEKCYAKMRNVWHIPSPAYLERLMKRCGFKNMRLVDMTPTSTKEQRRTSWMEFESLADFLDPEDQSRTIEGYPAPLRAIFIAETP